MPTGSRQNGDFCWINVLTPEPAKAQEFFAKTLGWTFGDLSGVGSSIKVDDHLIGGMFDLAAPNTPPGTPPLIGVMVKTDNADAIVEKANAIGGKAKPAFDVMSQGRMAEIKDTSDAHIDVWEPTNNSGTDADKSHHGAPSWFENYATDTDKAAKFYSELFGWEPEVMHMPGMDYTTFKLGGVQIAGMMAVSDQMPVPPSWAVYFTSTDIDNTAKIAKEAGGNVFVGPLDIPEVGRFAGIESPQGIKFFAITYKPRS